MIITNESNREDWKWLLNKLYLEYFEDDDEYNDVNSYLKATEKMKSDIGVTTETSGARPYSRTFTVLNKDKFMRAKLSR